jgi:hypothetical protein
VCSDPALYYGTVQYELVVHEYRVLDSIETNAGAIILRELREGRNYELPLTNSQFAIVGNRQDISRKATEKRLSRSTVLGL